MIARVRTRALRAAQAVGGVLRRRVAGPAGLALLLAGGALAVRVAVLNASGHPGQHPWLLTAAALVLAGVALVLITLPKIVQAAGGDDLGRREGPLPSPRASATPTSPESR